MARKQRFSGFRPKLVALAVASCFATSTALANPTGPTVVNGTAAILQNGNLLQVTNSPNSIINWQSFSIGASEITRFIQQSQASAVLNRVTGSAGAINPSVILGALQSNGRVFLVNPSGILFGAGAQVDVAGLVATSLNLSNSDFLAGKLKFTDGAGAGSVVNQGNITAGQGGQVYLVGPAVTISGIITSPNGEVVLAAGNSVELVNPGTPNLRVEITAPDNAARNLGQIVVDSGRAGIYAGLINNSGTIRADSVVSEGGKILLKATKSATLEAGSVTSANGAAGGSVTVQSGDTTLVAGTVEAKGAAGKGGNVAILGNLVGLTGNASVNASGNTGGGTVLVGGDFQGKNPEVQNAFRTYVGANTNIAADAITSGDGGKVIVWSDDATRFYGTISAKGGAQSGDGGFAEVSGKGYLDFRGLAKLSAARGKSGTLLLDPSDVIINDVGNGTGDDGSFDGEEFFLSGPGPSFISWTTIKNQLDPLGLANSNAIITTSGGQCSPGLCGDITIATSSPDLATPNNLTLLANRDIHVNGSITNTGTGGLSLYAGWDGNVVTPNINSFPFVGSIFLNNTSLISYPNSTVKLISRSNIEQDIEVPGSVTTANLLAYAPFGSVILDRAPNLVGTLAGRARDSFLFKNGQSLTIGDVDEGGAIGPIGGVEVEGGNNAIVNINVTSGALTVNESVKATGGGSGDTATVTLTALTGAITVSSATVGAYGGGGESGGSATVNLNAGTAITLNSGSVVQAKGGDGSCCGAPGDATVRLVAPGGITVNSSTIEAIGGNSNSSGNRGGSALVELCAGTFGTGCVASPAGFITVANSTVRAIGGVGGSSSSGFRGGDATVSLVANTVSINSGGILSATGGQGGFGFGSSSSSGGGVGFGGRGGHATITLTGNTITVAGSATATGGAGGTASFGSGGQGGDATVQLFGGAGGISINGGTVHATGGAGGTGSFGGSGGNASVHLGTLGAVSIGAGGVMVNGGNPVTGASGSGGAALLLIDGGVGGPVAGSVTIAGPVEVVGGNGAFGGSAAVTIGSATTIGLTAPGTIEAYAGAGAGALVSLNAGGNIFLNSGEIEAQVGCIGACSGNAAVIISSGGNIDLGATNISALGETAGTITISAPSGYIHNGSGILAASDTQPAGSGGSVIALAARDGIGTQVAPVRIQDGTDATGPDLFFTNTSTGDIGVSFVSGGITIAADVIGTFNANPTGTYFLQVESGNLEISAPFLPGVSAAAALLSGQNVTVKALVGDVMINTGASIDTFGAGIATATGNNIALNGGSVSGVLNATATAGNVAMSGGSVAGVLNAIATSGSVTQTGGNITALINANASSGNVNLAQAGSYTLGLLNAGGSVSVNSSGGAIVDGNSVVNVIAPTATLFGAGGIGSLANPLETQVGAIALAANGGEIGVINNGSFTLNGLAFSGTDASIYASTQFGAPTASLALGNPVNVSGNLSLLSDSGMTINKGVTAGGVLVLDAGVGDLNLRTSGVNTEIRSGGAGFLRGANVNIGESIQTSNLDVVGGNGLGIIAGNLAVQGGNGGHTFVRSDASDLVIAATGDVTVTGGTSGGFAHVLGTPDLVMSVGGTVHINATDSTAPARMEAALPVTIRLDFTTMTTGGYFVNGVESVVADAALGTGFYANGVPAVLGQNLLVTYGGGPGLADSGVGVVLGAVPGPIEQAINQIVASTNQQADLAGGNVSGEGEGGIGTGDPKDQKKKQLPICGK